MQEVTAAFVTLGLGVIAIAAIYQLAKPGGNALASTATGTVNNTVSKLFS